MNKKLLNELIALRNEFAHGANTSVELAKKLEELGITVPPVYIPAMIQLLSSSSYYVPQFVLDVIGRLLENYEARTVCDPWAGLGAVIATLQDTTSARKALAFTRNQAEAAVGKVLNPTAEWHVGELLQLLNSLTEEVDVVASVLPFGHGMGKPVMLRTYDGKEVQVRDNYGHQLFLAAALRLSVEGVGLFVIHSAFFVSQRSVLRQFHVLGLGVQAALALPSGIFAPYTNIPTYLIVVRRQSNRHMFVAQL